MSDTVTILQMASIILLIGGCAFAVIAIALFFRKGLLQFLLLGRWKEQKKTKERERRYEAPAPSGQLHTVRDPSGPLDEEDKGKERKPQTNTADSEGSGKTEALSDPDEDGSAPTSLLEEEDELTGVLNAERTGEEETAVLQEQDTGQRQEEETLIWADPVPNVRTRFRAKTDIVYTHDRKD